MIGDEVRWKDWICNHLDDRVSLPRIRRKGRDAGVDSRTVDSWILESGRKKRRRHVSASLRRIGAGALLLAFLLVLSIRSVTTGPCPALWATGTFVGLALAGVLLIQRGLRSREKAAGMTDLLDELCCSRGAAVSVSAGAPLLEGELLKTRLKHINSADLAAVQDVLHAFFRCPSCGKRSSKVAILGGNLFDILNDPARLSSVLTVEPERFIPDLGSEKCDCPPATPLMLTYAILCRINPRSRNDLHLIVQYEADGMASPLRVAVLEKNGAYSLLSEEESLKLLGFPTHASRH